MFPLSLVHARAVIALKKQANTITLIAQQWLAVKIPIMQHV
jgi:hypothetical protein